MLLGEGGLVLWAGQRGGGNDGEPAPDKGAVAMSEPRAEEASCRAGQDRLVLRRCSPVPEQRRRSSIIARCGTKQRRAKSYSSARRPSQITTEEERRRNSLRPKQRHQAIICCVSCFDPPPAGGGGLKIIDTV